MPEIRAIDISADDLRSENVTHFVRLFSPVTLKPSAAKELRGTLVLVSESLDSDARPNWQIPEWRRYLLKLFNELPHFSYFLLHAEQTFLGVVLAVMPPEKTAVSGGELSFDPAAMTESLTTLLEPVVAYSEEIYDDKEIVIGSLLQSFPAEVAAAVRHTLFARPPAPPTRHR
jgi:hypothetical protein